MDSGLRISESGGNKSGIVGKYASEGQRGI